MRKSLEVVRSILTATEAVAVFRMIDFASAPIYEIGGAVNVLLYLAEDPYYYAPELLFMNTFEDLKSVVVLHINVLAAFFPGRPFIPKACDVFRNVIKRDIRKLVCYADYLVYEEFMMFSPNTFREACIILYQIIQRRLCMKLQMRSVQYILYSLTPAYWKSVPTKTIVGTSACVETIILYTESMYQEGYDIVGMVRPTCKKMTTKLHEHFDRFPDRLTGILPHVPSKMYPMILSQR